VLINPIEVNNQNEKEWARVYKNSTGPFMLQEYVDLPLEFGVLCYRYPDGNFGIPSIVEKEFLTLRGDGVSSIGELLENNIRASGNAGYLKKKYQASWNDILEKGEEIVAENIGNHVRGTKFINACHLINDKTISHFKRLTSDMDDFQYGRFDLRAGSYEDLFTGDNLKILEVNGVNSEVAHIYDPEMKLLIAYKDVYENLKIVFEIARENRKSGRTTISFLTFVQSLIRHLRR